MRQIKRDERERKRQQQSIDVCLGTNKKALKSHMRKSLCRLFKNDTESYEEVTMCSDPEERDGPPSNGFFPDRPTRPLSAVATVRLWGDWVFALLYIYIYIYLYIYIRRIWWPPHGKRPFRELCGPSAQCCPVRVSFAKSLRAQGSSRRRRREQIRNSDGDERWQLESGALQCECLPHHFCCFI